MFFPARLLRWCAFATSLLLAVPLSAQLSPDETRYVTTDKDAYLILPPELVVGPHVGRVAVSSDGRYVLAERVEMRLTPGQIQQALQTQTLKEEPARTLSLIVWDNQTQAARTVWQGDAKTLSVAVMQWLPQSGVAYVTLMRNGPRDPNAPPPLHTVLLRIAPELAKAQPINLAALAGNDTDPDRNQFELHLSPTRAVSLLMHTHVLVRPVEGKPGEEGVTATQTLYLLNESGRIGPAIHPAESLGTDSITRIEWTPEGQAALNAPHFAAKDKPQNRWFLLDAQRARLRETPTAPALAAAEPENAAASSLPIRLHSMRTPAQREDTKEFVSTLWLERAAKPDAPKPDAVKAEADKTGRPRALIAAEAREARLLPHGDGLLYQAQGALWMAQIVRLDKAQFVAMRRKAEQIRAMSNAKQLGLGLMMYAQDYDETLPDGDGVNDKITPYLRNDSLFDNFTYTYAGGPQAEIKNPAETVLGYVTGPGGRAIIFADGHVRWKDNEK